MVRRSSGQGRSRDFAVQIILQAQDQASRIIAGVKSDLDGLGAAVNQFTGVSRSITFIGLGFQQIQGAITGARSTLEGFYQAFIGQNIQLEQQLLQTQASLAATIDVFQDDVRIDDVAERLDALAEPLERSFNNVRDQSLNLVGIVSDDLLPIFQVLASESGAIGANFSDVEDLTISFGAALSTLQLPVSDFGTVRQEIASILQGTISVDSTLAQSLGISNSMVQSWKEQEVLIQELNRRLEPFVKANESASRSTPGLLSNIVEIFQTITREAGEGLDELIAEDLARVYEFLQSNADRLRDTLVSAIQILVEGTAPLRQSFRDLAIAGAELGSALVSGAGNSLQDFATNIVQTLNAAATTSVQLITRIVQGLSTIAESGAGQAAIAVFIQIASVISNVTRGAFELLGRLVDGAISGLQPLGGAINQAIGFLQQLAPVINLARESFGLFTELIGVGLRQISGLFALVFEAAQPFIQTIAGPLIAGFRVLQEVAPPILQGIAVIVQQVFQQVLGTLENFANTVVGARELLRDLGLIQEEVRPATEGSAQALQEAAGAFGEYGAAASDAADDLTTAQRSLDALQQAVGRASREIERSTLTVNVDQSQEIARLQQQLNSGLISERQFQEERAAITEQGLDQQLAIVSAKVAELREQYDQLTEIEKQQAGESFDQIQQLEQQQAQLQTQLAEQQIQDRQALRDRERQDLEAAQSKANDAIKASVTQREIELQQLRNQGLLSERELQSELTKVNADRIDETLAQEQQRLAELQSIRSEIADDESQEAIQAEAQIRESEQRILDATKERLEVEQQLQQQAQEEIIRAIDERAQAAQNAATRESQAIDRQISLYDTLNSSLEQQSRLLQAQNDLRNAANQQTVSNLNIAASLTKNEKEREQLQAQAAVAQLQALREQQEFENQSLAIQQQLEQLAVRRRQIEAEAAEIQARAALAQAEADRARTQAAFERGDANEGDLEAADLAIQAAQAQIEVAQRRRGLANQEAALLPQQQAIARQQQEINQQGAENQSRADVITSLPENSAARRRLERQEIERITTAEQRRIGRSRRQTNQLAAQALSDNQVGSPRNRTQATQPQLASLNTEIAPLQSVQEDGNQILSRIEAGITALVQGGGQAAQISSPITVNVNGGQTNEQTGQSVAQVVRDVVEGIFDRAGAIQNA